YKCGPKTSEKKTDTYPGAEATGIAFDPKDEGAFYISNDEGIYRCIWQKKDQAKHLVEYSSKTSPFKIGTILEGMCASPDGKLLAIIDVRGNLGIFDAAKGDTVKNMPSGRNLPDRGKVSSVAFSSDSSSLTYFDGKSLCTVKMDDTDIKSKLVAKTPD